jgi:DNA polymerase I-like protein with 3'-5' exonuclease and polymerase domains
MTSWQPPAELPDLRRAGIIALDTETKDDWLAIGLGSGWPFSAGFICGISVAWHEGESIRSQYFPLRHPDTANFDPAQVFKWLSDLVASDVRIVTQNGLYDWGWLRTDAGILMPQAERLEEIGALATLIDENRYAYGLDALCAWRGLPGKDMVLLEQAAAAIGLSKRDNVRANLWRMPAHFVGPYAEQDPACTLVLFENLNPILDRERTRDAYRLEIDLLPMVHEMRRRGVRVDVVAAEQRHALLSRKRDAVIAELSEKLGTIISMDEIGRNRWLARTFDQHNIGYPRTPKGNPSFTAGRKGWMSKHQHWLPQLIAKANRYNKAAVDFLQTHILGHTVNGRIHAEIHPHLDDDGGTRSLRFSYSDPPLQQMVARDEEIAPLIRGAFLPEEGEVWAKPDISQQEFRFIVHYAVKFGLQRAGEAAERYRTDANTDFHQIVAEMTGLERAPAKDCNFGKIFGASVRKFAAMIGRPESEARAIIERYDRELPFVSQLDERCKYFARSKGYIELYDGARRHWDQWVADADWTKGAGPCSREEAERRIRDPAHPWYGRGPVHRAEVHKAMNALIQGSAARHTKLWMRAVWREGIVPLLQMHDCLDCSVASPEQAELVAQLGCEAVILEVPIQVDLKYGRNWGDATHTWEELQHGGTARLTTKTVTPSIEPTDHTGKLEINDAAAGAFDDKLDDLFGDGDDRDNGSDGENSHESDDDGELAQSTVGEADTELTLPRLINFASRERVAGDEQSGETWSAPNFTEVRPELPSGSTEFEAILAALSPEDRAIVRPPKANGGGLGAPETSDGYQSGERPWGHNTAEYIYRNVDSSPYLKVVRTSAKQFPQYHWNGNDWALGKPAGPKIPYRLPELIAAAPGVPVFVCEGEKDADRVTALGLVATTNSEGAGKGKWTADLNKWFAGKQSAYVLEDNDDDGRRHALEVAINLHNIVAEIRIVSFRELLSAGDVSDWLDLGRTKEEFLARAKTAAKFEPPKWNWRFHGEADPLDSRPWLVELLIPETGSGLLSGQWGTFKTFVALDLGAAVMVGGIFMKFPVTRRGAVLFIALEGENEVAVRVEAVVRAKGLRDKAPFAWITECPRLLDPYAPQVLTAMVKQAAERMLRDFGLPVVLVIIDTMGKAAGYSKTGDEDDAVIATKIESVLSAVSKATGAFVLGLDHFGKDPATGTRGSSGKEGHADIVLSLLGDKALSGAVTGTRLCIRKRKSGPNGEEFPFRTKVVEMGVDSRGTPVTTLIIDWTLEAEAATATAAQKDKWSKSLRLLRQTLMSMLADNGVELQPNPPDGPIVRAVDVEKVRREFYTSYVADGTEEQKAAARQKAFKRAVTDAQERGLIAVRAKDDVTFLWLAPAQPPPTENS